MREAARARLVVAALLTALLAAGPGAVAAQKAAGKPAPHAESDRTADEKAASVKVDGFRSANFGMTEAQLRAAIRKDFNLAGEKVAAEENPTEHTTALSVTVNDLLPDAGPARISYIMGFKSKRLFQVNILWGAPMSPEAAPEKLLTAAATLRDYFLAAGYPSDTVVTNVRAGDGSTIVFRGADAQKRTTLLRVIGGTPKEGEKPAAGLLLSYIQDPRNPDIFRIGKGQF